MIRFAYAKGLKNNKYVSSEVWNVLKDRHARHGHLSDIETSQ